MCYNTPRLWISNVVYGRRNLVGRVQYRQTANLEDEVFDIPEQIVLKRWKARAPRAQSLRFSGFRLSPNIWKSLHFAFGFDAAALHSYSIEEIDDIFIRKSQENHFKERHFKRMVGSNVKVFVEALGQEKLLTLLQRHNDPDFPERYGTPDLFLYALNNDSDTINHFRFVEVKKPDEPLSSDQVNELDFLINEMDLKARVLRLSER